MITVFDPKEEFFFKNHEFSPLFALYSFIADWNRNKQLHGSKQTFQSIYASIHLSCNGMYSWI